jgi:hypothetical protein
VVHWLLSLRIFFEDGGSGVREIAPEEIGRRVACLTADLEALGTTPYLHRPGDYIVEVDASFEQIKHLLRSDAISAYEVHCAGTDCEKCATLSVEQCEDDGLCHPIEGWRLDASQANYDYLPAGCHPGFTACDAALATALDPGGACWMFPSTCLPNHFMATDSQDGRCGYAHFEKLLESASP